MTPVTGKVRVLVVDDSDTQRQVLIHMLEQDPDLEVVGWAANGAEAVRAVERLRPDVITMDQRMPVMCGLDAARSIMRHTPTPIVMVSGASGAEARDLADAALAVGVLSIQDKQMLSGPATGAELVRLIKSMASVRVVRRRWEPRAVGVVASVEQPPAGARIAPEIVAIGASTGGPQALGDIITRLPANFPLPILVVQHTTSGYSHSLVDWLRAGTRLSVKMAEDGEPLDGGGVYLAPTARHLLVQGRHLVLLDTPPVALHRPSATVLFRSVAQAYGARAMGIVLTGMGEDGASGLAEMKRAGAVTVAQDEASCVVFGMPAEAIRLGAADHVLPPSRIVALLLDEISRRGMAA
jgi:two-component system, chemotaxis family, protein-glutamate methylesterase/glutaminase